MLSVENLVKTKNKSKAHPQSHFTEIISDMFYYVYLEKEMATHSSILAWKIPWTEDPGRL